MFLFAYLDKHLQCRSIMNYISAFMQCSKSFLFLDVLLKFDIFDGYVFFNICMPKLSISVDENLVRFLDLTDFFLLRQESR